MRAAPVAAQSRRLPPCPDPRAVAARGLSSRRRLRTGGRSAPRDYPVASPDRPEALLGQGQGRTPQVQSSYRGRGLGRLGPGQPGHQSVDDGARGLPRGLLVLPVLLRRPPGVRAQAVAGAVAEAEQDVGEAELLCEGPLARARHADDVAEAPVVADLRPRLGARALRLHVDGRVLQLCAGLVVSDARPRLRGLALGQLHLAAGARGLQDVLDDLAEVEPRLARRLRGRAVHAADALAVRHLEGADPLVAPEGAEGRGPHPVVVVRHDHGADRDRLRVQGPGAAQRHDAPAALGLDAKRPDHRVHVDLVRRRVLRLALGI
mmetsp:Transcript_76112/g.199633  ORF Transcript_76112/g.199633 Transcript_76112/m.199633 type:complete len:320 (-) Transcript_76112:285-1244(-)